MDYVDGTLQNCIKMRKWLIPCPNGGAGCRTLEKRNGEPIKMKPNTLAEKEHIVKNYYEVAENFVFHHETTKSTYEWVWTASEVMAALGRTTNDAQFSPVRRSFSIPQGLESYCQSETCNQVEYLWAGKKDVTGVGYLDNIVLGAKNVAYSTDVKGATKFFKGENTKRTTGYPSEKHVKVNVGNRRGAATGQGRVISRSSGKGKEWMDARRKFYHELAEWLRIREVDRQENLEDWHLHAQYFTQTVGPMVQEAFYINEVLNEMRGYLYGWAQKSDRVKEGETLELWPPDEGYFGEIQVIDSDNKAFVKQGYDKDKCAQSVLAEKSYPGMLAQGYDKILAVGMLEYLRRPDLPHRDSAPAEDPQEPPKNAKVLFGAFLRSDIPGADKDCSGALQSLQFAQALQDNIPGDNRQQSLPHIMHTG